MRYTPPDYQSTEPVEKRSVFAWGVADMCQLGLGPDVTDEKARPMRHRWFDNALTQSPSPLGPGGVAMIACGGMHTLALDSEGKVWSWGVSDDAALGRRTTQQIDPTNPTTEVDGETVPNYIPTDELEANPHLVHGLEGFPVVKVAAGDCVSVALGENGEIRTWGTFKSAEGPLGFTGPILDRDDKNAGKQYDPIALPGLSRFNFVDVACGTNHVVALTDDGRVVTWGNGQQAQLGRKIIERRLANALTPSLLALRNIVVVGAGHYSSFAVDKDGDVFAWGLNASSQCGIEPEDRLALGPAIWSPHLVESLSPDQHDGARVVQIEGGEHFTAFLFSDGSVWTCGRNDDGQCGLAADHPVYAAAAAQKKDLEAERQAAVEEETEKIRAIEMAKPAEERISDIEMMAAGQQIAYNRISVPDLCIETPQKVEFPSDAGPIVHIAAGLRLAFVITRSGRAYSWGYSAQSALGLIDEDKDAETLVPTPRRITTPVLDKRIILGGSAGGDFGMLLATTDLGPPFDAPAGWQPASAAPVTNGAASSSSKPDLMPSDSSAQVARELGAAT